MLAVALLISLAGSAYAQTTVVSYTFTGDTIVPEIGSSLSSLSWNSGGSVGYASTFTGQGRAVSVGNFGLGEYYQISLNAGSYKDLVLNSFRANGADAAPLSWKIAYSTTGESGPFTDASTFTLSNLAGVGTSTIAGVSLSSLANQSSSIVLRFIATTDTKISGVGAANGTVRLDNISISATAIPEPSTYAVIIGVLALVGTAIRRHRQRAESAQITTS